MTELYRPLESRSIRLLSFADEGSSSFKLEHYSLDAAPPYVALSYTWRKDSLPEEPESNQLAFFNVNGISVEVGENLHDAVRFLHHDIREEKCMLWADAVCINQNDSDERAAQVRMMKEIYERADFVFAWLGIPSDDQICNLLHRMMIGLKGWLIDAKWKGEDDMADLIPRLLSTRPWFPSQEGSDEWKAWEGFEELMSSSYWSRFWTAQEASTSAYVRFYHGLQGYVRSLLLWTLIVRGNYSRIRSSLGSSHGKFHQVGTLSEIRREALANNMLEILQAARGIECTDPRDYVYAALGHTSEDFTSQVIIDYRRDFVDVYIDVVRCTLHSSAELDLRVLSFVSMPAEDAGPWETKPLPQSKLPSWVPDWRGGHGVEPLHTNHDTPNSGSFVYNPLPGSIATGTIAIQGLELKLRGHVVTTLRIEILTSIYEIGNYEFEKGVELLRTWRRVLTAPKFEDEQLDVSIRRSMLADVRESYENTYWVKRRGEALPRSFMTVQDLSDETFAVENQLVFMDLHWICWHRRMGKTIDGRIALLPAAARVGDFVAAFYGGHVLYVLRAIQGRQDTYAFVGECYVDGLMDGAILDLCQGEEKQPKTITLV